MASGSVNIDTYDGMEIAVTVSGVKLYSLQSIDWDSKQKKEFLRSIGKMTRGKPVNEGDDVIGISRGVIEYSLSMEFLEFNGAVLEPATDEVKSGVKDLDSFTIAGQKVTCLQDLRELEIVISYPIINGIKRRPKFLRVEFTDVSGGIKIGEAPGMKASAIAAGAIGIV